MSLLSLIGATFFCAGVVGVLLCIAGGLYIWRCSTASAVPDPIALIIVLAYKHVIAATVALLAIGVALRYWGS